MKTKKEWQRQKEADDVFCQKADRQMAIVQVQQKNWLKRINLELLASPLSEEEMNLIELPPLTTKQQVRFLPKETLEDDIISWPESRGEEMETVERIDKRKGRGVVEEYDNEQSEMDIKDRGDRMEVVEEETGTLVLSVQSNGVENV